MQPPHQHQRINLVELKAQIVMKLGQEKSKQYFNYLDRFLSLRLSKVEFNKFCLQIVGRENIPLHNQFIRSILKNACSAKVPPPAHDKEVVKLVGADGTNEPQRDGHKQSLPNPSILSNGNIRAHSTRKGRRDFHDRTILDRPSPFGPNGKTNNGDSIVILENGVLTPHDIRRPVQHHQGLIQQAEENEGELPHYHSADLSLTERLPDGSVSAHGKDPVEAGLSEDRKEVFSRSLLRAPLGVPLCPVSVGGARRMMPLESSSNCASSINSGGLLGTAALRQRMEQIAATQGLEGVTMDCANLLNRGLDAYLKGLITSCIELVGARSGHDESRKSNTNKHPAHLKLVNGVRPGHHVHMQSSSKPMESIRERKPPSSISLLDFRVAMEVNPQQLGEDWPILLEKICTNSFEE